MTPTAPFAEDIVVIGASAGGQQALREVLDGLPSSFPAVVLVVMHIGPRDSKLPSILARSCKLPVKHAASNEALVPGLVLIAPPDWHMIVRRDAIGAFVLLNQSPREKHSRPAIDPLFRSAAAAFGRRTTGVILSGMLDDGTIGLKVIKTCGGQTIVQLPADAAWPDMPSSAILHGDVDRIMRARDIGALLVAIVARARRV